MRNIRRIVPLVIAAMIAGVGWWASLRLAPVSIEEVDEPADQADFRIEGLEATATTPQGRKQYVLRAEIMTQYPKRQGAELLAPDLTQYDANGIPTRTTAERGHLSADKTLLSMTGKVRVFRPQQGKQGETLLETGKLTIKLNP